MTHRILIADDDLELCRLLTDYLSREGLQVDVVHDGQAALEALRDEVSRPELLILDVTMPVRDGLSALRELRAQYGLPVIILSARGEPVDRIVGLELGADDYLSKPFLPRELLARIRALLRRSLAPPLEDALVVDALRLHPGERRAWIDDTELTLTSAEYRLLLALARRAGTIVDKSSLTREALGRDIERYDRSIDVHVSRLRRKLMDASDHAPAIETIRGTGYLLARKIS